jgi:hypothetical protein
MCAKQSLKQPASAKGFDFLRHENRSPSSLVPGNTIRSGYHNWRLSPRGDGRSPVRNDAGRNALSGVKVSSPVKHTVPEWPSNYTAAKATPTPQKVGTLGVQVHGMYRRLSQELGRSPFVFSLRRTSFMQDVMLKCKATQRREVRWFRSSEEVE